MDRMEEYTALLRDLEELPPALAGTVGRAKARRRRLRLRRCLAPAGSAAAVFAAFVLAVNLWTPFALACGRVPILKELAAAVAFSPTLKTAVEHDYVQYIGQRQTDNGITVDLEYLMADQGGLTFFLSISGPEEAAFFLPAPKITDLEGEALTDCSIHADSVKPGELTHPVSVTFKGETAPVLPEGLILTLEVYSHIPGITDVTDQTPDAVLTFSFPLDARFQGQGRTVAVDRWLELDGGRLYVESLELYPTHARLNLEQDPENDAVLQSLEFYVEDGKGNRYGRGADNGLVSMGDSYLFESPYFDRPGALTLCVTGAEWLEKGREFVTVDLETGGALTPLPRQVSVRALRTERGQAVVAFLAPEHPDSTPERQHLPRAGTGLCRAPDGTERDIGAVSCRTAGVLWPGTDRETAVPEGYFIEEYVIEDYPWDTIDMGLQYTRRTYFREPVTLPLM